MNMKTVILSIIALVGTYTLGFPLSYSLLTFNVIFLGEIAYNLVLTKNGMNQEDSTIENQAIGPDPMQIEFERFLVRKYLELVSLENQQPEEEIQYVSGPTVAMAEA